MKYFSITTVENAYKQISTQTNNKFWGILSIVSSIGSLVKPKTVYNLDINNVSNLLERQFSLTEEVKEYNRDYSWNVIFSNSWADYIAEKLLRNSPNIYDVIVWYFRREAFDDNVAKTDLVSKFLESTNISQEVAKQIFSFTDKDLQFSDSKYAESALLTKLKPLCSNASSNTTITAEKSFVAANAGELSRAPFVQTLYAGQGVQECMIITQFDFNEYYGVVVKKPSVSNIKGTKLIAIKNPTTFVWECIKYFSKQNVLHELFESKWYGKGGYSKNYIVINGNCYVAKEGEGFDLAAYDSIEIYDGRTLHNDFDVRTEQQMENFIYAINTLFAGRYSIYQDG